MTALNCSAHLVSEWHVKALLEKSIQVRLRLANDSSPLKSTGKHGHNDLVSLEQQSKSGHKIDRQVKTRNSVNTCDVPGLARAATSWSTNWPNCMNI